MLRIYYAMVPLDIQRPGGAWWFRDLPDSDAEEFIEILRPVAVAIRTSRRFIKHDPLDIRPPEDAQVEA